MYPTTFVAVILGFWSTFHLIQTFLMKTPFFGRWLQFFILNNNITISYFHIRWVTGRWNRYFVKLSRIWTLKLKIWFNFGIFFAAIFMAVGTVMLVHTLSTTINTIFFKPQAAIPDKPVLSVIVPGVNLPIHDVAYLLPTIFISAILHELGHAIAATREGVQVNGFGIFAFLIYPGAFVDLNSDDMNKKNAASKLRVYCAGVWHNFVICVIVGTLLFSLPVLIHPFYYTSTSSVLVTYQSPNSPLSGAKGLQTGDKVIKIDSCRVSNVTSWLHCIEMAKKSPQWGSCMSQSKIKTQMSYTTFTSVAEHNSGNKSWRDCCSAQAPSTHLCYSYDAPTHGIKHFVCLPGRMMVSAHDECTANNDCSMAVDGDIICAKAYTEPGLKFIRLVVERPGHENHNVLYVGSPADILQSVTVSELVPRLPIFPLKMPSIIQRFLQYLFSMSGALALLNIIPCYALDGQWAFKALLDYLDGGRWCNKEIKQIICSVTLGFGTSLLALNILFGFIRLFIK